MLPKARENANQITRIEPSLASQTGLLKTKLYMPPLRENVVCRASLIDRLNSSLFAKLILVSAPAGFGKTALIAEWITARQQCSNENHMAWLSLEAADNDLGRFWKYIIAALQSIDSRLGHQLVGMLDLPSIPQAETWLPTLLHDLENLTGAFTLVLDDYQVIRTHATHQSLSYLLQHLPANGQVVLITRADPPLPLSRLRLQGDMVELRAVDLLFSRTEIEEFLNDYLGLDLSPQELDLINQRTEGWPAGIKLAARSLQSCDALARHDFVRTFSGSNRFVLNYLLEEVLKQQEPSMRDFLLRTSILPQLCGPLCAAVTGQPSDEAGRILSRLAKECLFITPLDENGNWFRYYSLFAEALSTRLCENDLESWKESHRKAGAWCAENGHMECAIHHALTSNCWEEAVSLIERYGDKIWSTGDASLPLSWLEALPQGVIEERMSLRLLHIWLLILKDRWDEAANLWRQAGHHLNSTPDAFNHYERGRWAAMGGTIGRFGHVTEESIRLAQQALDLLPQADSLWRAVSQFNLALAHQMQGNSRYAAATYREMAELCQDQGYHYLAFAALVHLIETCHAQGHLYEAQAHCERLRERQDMPGNETLPLRAAGDIGLGRLAYERNDLLTAKSLLIHAIDRVWPQGQPRLALIGWITLSRVEGVQGDRLAARRYLETALDMSIRLRLAHEEKNLRAHLARLSLEEARWDDVRCWQAAARISPNDLPDPWHEVEYGVLAEILIAEGNYHQAEALLARLRAAAERGGRMGCDITLSLLYAVSLARQKRLVEADVVVRRVLALAQSQNYIRTFLDLGAPVMELLHRPGIYSQAPAYIDRLCRIYDHEFEKVQLFHSNGHSPHATLDLDSTILVDPLTPREWEILSMIAKGASNQEIADRLILSVGTVKGHVNHIFSKLDVHNRTAAVARARDFRLIYS